MAMSIGERLQALFSAQTIEPLEVLDKARTILREACKEGGECDPLGEKWKEGVDAYAWTGLTLARTTLRWAAEQLLFEWWNDLGDRQLKAKKRLYRAMAAFTLTSIYRESGDLGAAMRWALLTQAHDILGDHDAGGGGGKMLLRTMLGMSESELSCLNGIAGSARNKVRDAHDDWTIPEGFAEDAVLEFALQNPGQVHLFGQPSRVREFPLSKAFFRILLDRIEPIPAYTTTEKGRALEHLASYLFLLVPGWLPSRNVMDRDRALENDVLVTNLEWESNLTAELLGRHFLVECKNWEASVGSRDIGYFLYRMRLTHSKFGIVFAKNGISGETDRIAATTLIGRAFHEDGSACVVLTRDDLETLLTSKITFLTLILQRVSSLQFGVPQ